MWAFLPFLLSSTHLNLPGPRQQGAAIQPSPTRNYYDIVDYRGPLVIGEHNPRTHLVAMMPRTTRHTRHTTRSSGTSQHFFEHKASNAKSRIDNICLQQTNLVCNFGRQGLSAFCTILAARASAFLKRFVKHKSRQTLSADLSADLSAISKVWGGRSKAL